MQAVQPKKLQAKSKVQTDVLDDLLLAKNASTKRKMQESMGRVSQACDNFDLKISTTKIEVVYQPAPGKPYSEPTIKVNGQKLQVFDKFTNLCLEQCTLTMRLRPELLKLV